MKRNLFSNFVFLNIKFDKYHYTDNRVGVQLYYLAYMLKGKAKIKSADETIYVNEGDVFFIPKNLGYQSYWYGEDEIDFLSCGFTSLMTEDDLNCKLQLVSCDDDVKEEISNIFENDRLDCNSLIHFYTVMQKIIPALKPKNDSAESVITETVKSAIENNPHSLLSEIAKECAISESYLYSVFKHTTDTTPNDYKQKIICEKAIELLLTTNKTVEEISSLLNFSSSSYFRKVMKKQTGSTPHEIRKNRGF